MLPVLSWSWLWREFDGGRALEFITGFVVATSLSVDNLFVFILLLAGFAAPSALRQRVSLFVVVGAQVLRGVLIAARVATLQAGAWAFLVFGLILLVSAANILNKAVAGITLEPGISKLRAVLLVRGLMPDPSRPPTPARPRTRSTSRVLISTSADWNRVLRRHRDLPILPAGADQLSVAA